MVEQEGVDGGKDLGTIEMGVADEGFDVFDGVGGCLAGAEGGGADVEGVGAVVDGLAAELQVLGGGEQFELHTRINEDSSFLLQ